LKEEEQLNMLVFGTPGIGKTHLIGTAAMEPRLRNILLVDMEGNTASIASKLTTTSLKDLKAGSYRPTEGKITRVPISLLQIKPLLDYLYVTLDKKALLFDTICLDSAGELNWQSLADIANESYKRSAKKDTSDPYGGIAPTQHDYLVNKAIMEDILRQFKNLGAHFIATCHSETVKDEDSGKITIKPLLPGKLAASIPGLFNIAGYLSVTPKDSTRRNLRVQPTDKLECAKTQFEMSTLGESIDYSRSDPVMSLILDGLGFKPLAT
jgi:hypothetical protein